MDRAMLAGIVAAVVAAIMYWKLVNGGDNND